MLSYESILAQYEFRDLIFFIRFWPFFSENFGHILKRIIYLFFELLKYIQKEELDNISMLFRVIHWNIVRMNSIISAVSFQIQFFNIFFNFLECKLLIYRMFHHELEKSKLTNE